MRAGECQPHARVLMGRARRARRANERCKVYTGRREREIKKAEIRKSKSSQRCNVQCSLLDEILIIKTYCPKCLPHVVKELTDMEHARSG